MSDHLTVTARLATVLGMVKQVLQCLDDNKDASKDRKSVRLEITSLCSVLLYFDQLLQPRNSPVESDLAITSLDIACGPLDQLKHALDSLAVKLAPTSGLGRLEEMIAWPLEKTKFKKIMDTIERQKSLVYINHISRKTQTKTALQTAMQLEDVKVAIGDLEMWRVLQKEEFREMLNVLFQHGADIESRNADGMTALARAAKYNNLQIAEYLLDKGAALEGKDCRGQTPLLWAAKRGCIDVVKLLVHRGANVTACDNQNQIPYSWAIKRGHKATAEILHQIGGVNLEAKDKWYSAETYEMLERSKGAWATQVNSRDKDGRTLLSRAAEYGHEAASSLLLEYGADLELEDGQGRTPLLWAAKRGHESIVKLFLDHGANIEVTDTWFQRTSLSWAVKRGQQAVVQCLLESKADIEAADKEGRTALWLASKEGFESVVEILLQHNANAKAKDISGRDVVMIAEHNKHEGVLKLLKATVPPKDTNL